MLNEVADGVWVRQSEWVWTNSIVVRGEDGLVVIDPGIHGSELEELAESGPSGKLGADSASENRAGRGRREAE